MRINSQNLLGWLNRQNFLVAGTLLLTVSPFLSVAFYCGAALRTAFGGPTIVLTKERKVLTGILFVISIWFAGRNFLPEEIGPGKVAFTDYVPFFWFFYAVSLRPFSTRETKNILYAFLFTIPQQFLLAIGEKYLNWMGRFYFPARKFPLIDIYVGSSEVGLATSASFFNPNILALYGIMGAVFSICLWLLDSEDDGGFNKNPFLRPRILFFSLCLVFSTLLLIWTHSRNAWFFLLFIVLIFSWIKKNRALRIIGIGLLLVTLAAILNFIFPNPFAKHLIPGALMEKLTVFSSDRGLFYNFAWELIREKPLTGWGIGMFPSLVASKLWYKVLHTHSILLQLAVEVGLPFAIGLIGLLGVLMVSTAKRIIWTELIGNRKEVLDRGLLMAGVVIFLMQFFDLALLMTYRLNFLFWLCLAIPYSRVSASVQEDNRMRIRTEASARRILRSGKRI